MKVMESRDLTVITDLPEPQASAWVNEFNRFSDTAQQLLGIREEELLPLTVLLFEKSDRFLELVPASQKPAIGPELLAMTVGLGQQPMMATSPGKNAAATLDRMRSGTIMWLTSSAGLKYDPFVVQGCIDFLGNLEMRGGEWFVTGKAESFRKNLQRLAKQGMLPPLDLGRAPGEPAYAWIALHYLLVARDGWKGFSRVVEYQRGVDLGLSRPEAFVRAFGLPWAKAEAEIAAFIKGGKVMEAKIGAAPAGQLSGSGWHELKDGVADCLEAQFALQQLGADRARAAEQIKRAEALMPEDPRVHEAWFFYFQSGYERGAAREALTRAVRYGARNPFLRLQWCVDLINDRVLTRDGFVCDEASATAAADVLTGLIQANPGEKTAPRLLAQFIPSIVPPREADRALLMQTLQRQPKNSSVNLGLAAWAWRHGDLEDARQRLASLQIDGEKEPIAKSLAEWLEQQLAATALLAEARAALVAGKMEEAQGALARLAPLQPGNREIKLEADGIRRCVDLLEMASRAEEKLKAGSAEEAETLLGIILSSDPPKDIEGRISKLQSAIAASKSAN